VRRLLIAQQMVQVYGSVHNAHRVQMIQKVEHLVDQTADGLLIEGHVGSCRHLGDRKEVWQVLLKEHHTVGQAQVDLIGGGDAWVW
jgi:hypothetical protein